MLQQRSSPLRMASMVRAASSKAKVPSDSDAASKSAFSQEQFLHSTYQIDKRLQYERATEQKKSKAALKEGAEEDYLPDPKLMPAERINSLSVDPYGWMERGEKQAPLWMLYEAEREEINLKLPSGAKREKKKFDGVTLSPPMRDEHGRSYATGRRKTAVARVWVKLGDGQITVNGKPFHEYFTRMSDRLLMMQPLVATQTCGAFDVNLTTRGGGITGQAGAARHGLANALARYDPFLKPVLNRLGLMKRDPRMVERKKPGRKKARKSFQWVKR